MSEPLIGVCFYAFAVCFTFDFIIVPLTALSETALSQFDYRKMVTAYSDYETNTLANKQ